MTDRLTIKEEIESMDDKLRSLIGIRNRLDDLIEDMDSCLNRIVDEVWSDE